MSKVKYIIISMVFGLLSCTSQKTLTKSNSFEIGSAVCQQWVGGKEESGSGIHLMIPITFPENASVVLKDVFFRGKQVPAILFSEGDTKFIKAEIATTDETSKETINLKLDATQAVLSYIEDDTLKYTKISGIKEKQPLLYNSRPKN